MRDHLTRIVILTIFGSISRNLGDIFQSPGLEYIAKILENRAEDPQNHNARKALPPTLSVLKRSRAIFRPASSKVRVQKVFLCPFHWKARPPGVSLESPGLENIPLFAGNRAEVSQNHDARKAVSATLLV